MVIACPQCATLNADGARFCSSCGTALAPATPLSEMRKTVTILFCDAVRSTSVAERVDPESLRRVMTRYFDEIRTIVERHGGVVEKFIGDAVMAVFGVPTVHEDDALRAVRAAAQIRDRLAVLDPQLERERGISVAWRTGINTGEVVAGDARAGQRFVTGDAVNVAARLEQAAQPAEILIGADTYLLVRDAVSVEPVQSILARGRSAPVDAYRLMSASPGAAVHAHRLASPMVGRGRPRRLLAEAYEQAMGERICHLFTVLGAAGVGKSRLVNEFLPGLDEDVLVLHGRCLPYGEGITYWPIAEVVRRAAGLEETDDEKSTRRKIGSLVDDDRDRLQVVERIGGLMGLLEAGGAAEETFWAVRTLLESIARQRPLVVVLDDLHWAEPTLLDLVEHIADWTRDAPLLLVCLARQDLLEARPSWGGGKANATTVTLEPLDEGESRQLVVNLLGLVDLDAPLGDRIAMAAEGNPLFVEEMLGMLIDNGDLVRENGGWRAASDLARVAVPPTIQALLAARLDNLPPNERQILERGSVEGKVFHRSAVAELVRADIGAAIPTYLRSLARKELVRPDRSTFTGDDAFRFRHQLIRDAAYGSLPKETRADLHARFARWLMRVASDRLAEYEEILGYHFEQAYRYRAELGPADEETRDLGAAAADHLANSGRRAVERGDIHAATRLLERAVELAPADAPARPRLLADLGDVLARAGDVRAGDRLLLEAIGQARQAGDTLGAAWAEVLRLDTLGTLNQMGIEETIRRSQELLAIFEKHGDERGAERASFMLAQNHFFAGRISVAEKILSDQVARYQAGEAPDIFVTWLLGIQYWGPTSVDESRRRIPELVGKSRSSRFVEAWALQIEGGLRGMVGEFDAGRQLLNRAMAMMEDLGQRIRAQRAAGIWLGPLEMLAANFVEAERVLVGAHDSLRDMGDRGFSATVAGYVAELYVRMGRFDDADKYVTITLDNASADDADAQAQALSTGARVLTARGDAAGAERMVRQALEIAEGTEYATRRAAVWWDLGEVLLASGRPEEANQAVRSALQHFEAKGVTVEAQRMRRRLAQIEVEGNR